MSNSAEQILQAIKSDLQCALNAQTSGYRDGFINKAVGRVDTLLTIVQSKKVNE